MNSLNKNFSWKRIQSLYKSIDKDTGTSAEQDDEFMLIMDSRAQRHRNIERKNKKLLGKSNNLTI